MTQVFDGTPAANEGTLQSGDELLGVNGQSVKGKTKVAVAKMIQAATNEVTIHYNKLHADPTQGESLDITLKKLKHRFVEGELHIFDMVGWLHAPFSQKNRIKTHFSLTLRHVK